MLNQLDSPGTGRSNGGTARPSRSNSDPRKRYTPGKQEYRLSPEAERLSDHFIAYMDGKVFSEAWQTLQRLEKECEGLKASEARLLFKKPLMVASLHALLSQAQNQWLEQLAGAQHATKLPTPLDIHQTLYRLRATNPSLFQPTLWHAAFGIADIYFAGKANNKPVSSIPAAVRELVQMWRVTMAVQALIARGTVSNFGSSRTFELLDDETDWSFLPPPAMFASYQSERRSHQAFENMLRMLLPTPPEHHGRPNRATYATAALLTVDFLRTIKVGDMNGQSTSLAQLPENAPFVQILEAILKITPAPSIPTDLLYKLKRTQDSGLLSQYEAMIARLQIHRHSRPGKAFPLAEESTGAEEESAPITSGVTNAIREHRGPPTGDFEFAEKPQSPQIESFALLNVKRLGRAIEQRDMYHVEKIKREVYAFAGSHQGNPKAVPLELYEHLMLAFLSLRNANAAIDVWNHVLQSGYRPTVKTYSVMMRGARTSRDRNGLEAFWHKMRQAGLRPDSHAWSIRIGGLFGLNAEKEGMQALNAMAREWLAAAKADVSQRMTASQFKQFMTKKNLALELLSSYPGPVNGVPRPDVVAMNSAISSLAHKNDSMIGDVLRWGRSLGIEPDLTTYNTLLNVSMRKGQAAEATNILQGMQKRGINADSTTWTVLLTSLFQNGFLDGVDHDQQQKKILDFLQTLEDKDTGMPGLDVKAYALIIDRLLKFHSNPTAANAVMARMIDRGHEPTCHIYTILITHYFDMEPQPDLAAVQHLWSHIQSQHNGWGAKLDNIFFDRMIEGYARHHHLVGIQHALNFRKRAQQAGQRTGWYALEKLARALAEKGNEDQLRKLVNDVKEEMQVDRVGTSGKGPNGFFSFIIDTGVFAKDGIVRTEQLLPAHAQEGPLLRAAARAYERANWN